MDALDLSNLASFAWSAPEFVLAGGVVALILLDLVVSRKEWLGEGALLLVATATLLVGRMAGDGIGRTLFDRSVALDEFAIFFKLLLLLSSFATIWMSIGSREVKRSSQGEYYAILIAATLAMLFMASANNLLVAYLSLEFLSLCSYVLTGFAQNRRRSGEASLKYLIYGGVASGVMIYGMSWLYGLAGSLDFAAIQAVLAKGDGASLALYIALVLTLVGLGYKISAFPMHMWAPDVYEGAPIPVTAFLAVGSKAAGFALTIRFLFTAMARSDGAGGFEMLGGVGWDDLILGLSVATMTFGNLAALNQQSNVKRLLAYSSIAHAGYLLMGIVVLNGDGLRAMLFYLSIYYIMNLGAFVVVMLVSNSTGREDLAAYRGLAWRGGALPAVAMAVFMFSLTGLPPLAGFVGKFYLFAAVIQKQLYLLAVVGVLNSVLSLFYYAKIVRTMFLEQPTGDEGAPIEVDWHNGVLLGLLTLATLVLGLWWQPLIAFADRSARFFPG